MLDEYFLKVCIIGSPDELKTKMARTFAEGKFTRDYLPTVGVDITTKQIKVNNKKVKLALVDTMGQEFFGKLRPSYYRGASAAIITFEKGDKDSFHAVKDWYKEFRKHIPQLSVPIALVGIITEREPKVHTKVYTPTFLKIPKRLKNTDWIDWANRIERANNKEINNNEEIYEEVTTDEGQSLAEELGVQYFETQPTDKKAIEGIFHDLTRKVLKKGS